LTAEWIDRTTDLAEVVDTAAEAKEWRKKSGREGGKQDRMAQAKKRLTIH
jgi:hypothetical protein